MTLSLTLVIPCFREAERLLPERFLAFLSSTAGTHLLFVDDGSPDDTPQVLRALAARMPDRIEVLTLPRNAGKGEAVRQGLLRAMETGPDLVGFWDADLAAPLELAQEFRQILEIRPESRWVLGSRWRGMGRDIRRKALRHYLGRVFATAVSMMLGLPVYDTQCGAKVFRADSLLKQILSEPFISRWIFDVEMLARLLREHRAGLASPPSALVYEHPLSTWHHDGRSHVRAGDFIRAAADLWRIGRHTR